jgi:hypothetical protein
MSLRIRSDAIALASSGGPKNTRLNVWPKRPAAVGDASSAVVVRIGGNRPSLPATDTNLVKRPGQNSLCREPGPPATLVAIRTDQRSSGPRPVPRRAGPPTHFHLGRGTARQPVGCPRSPAHRCPGPRCQWSPAPGRPPVPLGHRSFHHLPLPAGRKPSRVRLRVTFFRPQSSTCSPKKRGGLVAPWSRSPQIPDERRS